MSERSTQNATTTVQVKEVGLPEQASVGKVLAVAGLAGAALAGVGVLLSPREEAPATKGDQARSYLKAALENAQSKDLAKMSRGERKKAEKKFKKNRKNTEAAIEQARKKANDSANIAKGEFNSFLETLKGGGKDLERLAEEFAESTVMNKLREFGEEARVISEQGRAKGSEATHKAQTDLIPQARKAAKSARESGKDRVDEVVGKAKKDYIPAAQHAVEDVVDKAKKDYIPAAQHAVDDLVDKAKKDYIPSAQHALDDVVDKTKKDIIPNAQKASEEVQQRAHQLGERMESDFQDAKQSAQVKSEEASEAVKRSGRETRSLLLWLSLAGILIFTVFLDEEQQKRLKEITVEVFGEARDMYSDMKGDAQNS